MTAWMLELVDGGVEKRMFLIQMETSKGNFPGACPHIPMLSQPGAAAVSGFV